MSYVSLKVTIFYKLIQLPGGQARPQKRQGPPQVTHPVSPPMNPSADACVRACAVRVLRGQGVGCSFDSPTQLAQLLGVGVERDRERTRCTGRILRGGKEEETQGPSSPRIHLWTGMNKQAKRKDKEQTCHECYRDLTPQVFHLDCKNPSLSLSRSTLISVKRHSVSPRGSSA